MTGGNPNVLEESSKAPDFLMENLQNQLKIRVMAKSPSNLKDLGLNIKFKRPVETYKQLVYIIRRLLLF